MRRKKRRKTMIELPNKKPLTFEFERTVDDCSERQIAATFIEKIAPDDEKENAQKMAQKIRGNEKSSLVAKRLKNKCRKFSNFSKDFQNSLSLVCCKASSAFHKTT
jgi:hypothetical protein